MFFKRARKDKLMAAGPGADPVSQAPQQVPSVSSAARPAALPSSALRRLTDPSTLGFKTTAELSPPARLSCQDQALAALAVGASIRSSDHNIVIIGAVGSSERSAILSELRALAANQPGPSDWVYVADFDNKQASRALQLPAGSGRLLAIAMDEVIAEIRSAIVATLAGDSYQTRWRAIDAECQARHRAGLDALARTADAHSIALLRTPMGYAVAPAHEGSVVHRETFSSMPPSMQADVRAHITALEADLSELLENAPQVDRQRRIRLSELNREVLLSIARAALAEPRQLFARHPAVMDYFAAVEADVLVNANSLLPTIDIGDVLGAEQLAPIEDQHFDLYRVNVFVSRSPNALAAPVEHEPAPGRAALFGGLKRSAATATAPHMQLVAGALHRANGGFLLLDARDLTAAPQAWSALLAAIEAGAISPPLSDGDFASPVCASPVPLDVKIILLSDADHWRNVLARDSRFAELFKIEVVFAGSVARTLESERDVAGRIADIAAREGLEPLEAAAVAELIELSARKTGGRDRLSLAAGDLTGLMWEADVLRAQAGRDVTSRDDITKASVTIAHRKKAPDAQPSEDLTQSAVGVTWCLEASPTEGIESRIEGLAVTASGPRVRRVTARIHLSLLQPGSIDISGPSCGQRSGRHSRIASYLASEFGHDGCIAVAAALESWPPVKEAAGRDATCAELMAVLSAISELPLPPAIAVAGTFDQFGNAQGEGHSLNEAIEEFFDASKAMEIEGERGVIIPATAVSCLMLRRDIPDAVEAGGFSVWPINTVAECFSILTGQSAGSRGDDGRFAEGDAYRRVDERLNALNERASLRLSPGKVKAP